MTQLRLPSIKTLSQVFEDPKRARAILEMTREELRALPFVADYLRQCYSAPPTWAIRMEALSNLDSGLFGVEEIHSDNWERRADYINAGDTYTPTVIRWEGRYRVQSLGDFIEIQERRGRAFV